MNCGNGISRTSYTYTLYIHDWRVCNIYACWVNVCVVCLSFGNSSCTMYKYILHWFHCIVYWLGERVSTIFRFLGLCLQFYEEIRSNIHQMLSIELIFFMSLVVWTVDTANWLAIFESFKLTTNLKFDIFFSVSSFLTLQFGIQRVLCTVLHATVIQIYTDPHILIAAANMKTKSRFGYVNLNKFVFIYECLCNLLIKTIS